MHEDIEKVAQEIWGVLQRDTTMTLAGLVREVPGTTASRVAMAVGWLARDDKVVLGKHRCGLVVSLNGPDPIRVRKPKI